MIHPFFPKKETSYDFKRFECLYNYDRKHTLIVNDYFNFFFSEKVDLNRKTKNLFIILLNTLDIKYLHMSFVNRTNLKAFLFVLRNLKKNIHEIVFYGGSIYDEKSESLYKNANFTSLKKIVFLEPYIATNEIFSSLLKTIN
ncbi:hypothetical protein CWI36_0133p0020 [Hamiltosporidium magnivora]|uniref:Uncharacterized protein n=1 Tax=Hamiltosporidium magnivora TaxID=148818 RepID=A0A4Q9LMP2_9MICR|nr:hypothetical protein CWI36_0133p0020 [Hamiltosporidium magnivora]